MPEAKVTLKTFLMEDVNTAQNPTHLPTLKFVVSSVGQVNNLGNTMYIGMGRPLQTSPSAIWMFCISVASLA